MNDSFELPSGRFAKRVDGGICVYGSDNWTFICFLNNEDIARLDGIRCPEVVNNICKVKPEEDE